MTITLSEIASLRLVEAASQRGMDAEEALLALLDEQAEADARDFEESCAAIRESLADESGDLPFEEYVARHKAKFGK